MCAEKTLKDAGDKVDPKDKKEVEEKVKALKNVLEEGVKDELEAKSKDLSEALQKIGAAMYEAQQKEEASKKADSNDEKGDKKNKTKKSEDKTQAQEGEVVEE